MRGAASTTAIAAVLLVVGYCRVRDQIVRFCFFTRSGSNQIQISQIQPLDLYVADISEMNEERFGFLRITEQTEIRGQLDFRDQECIPVSLNEAVG